MNNFKNYLQESSIKPAKLSSGRFSIGNQFRLLRDIDGLEKGNEYTLIPIDEECDLIVLGGIGEYSFKDQKTNKKYCIHAGPRIIDELFELIPLADPSPSLSESKEPQAAQAYPVSERVIERIIVEGDKGERGERGIQGLIGPVGPAGPKGERGDKGDKGDVGERGERGEPGPIGPRGERGETGIKGDRGERGEQGLQGIEGKQGPAGLNGDIGPIGPQGERGLQGEKGERGEKGDTGETGPQGLQGEIGPSGPAGVNGAPGPIGPKGEKGDKGDTGPRGEKGDTGDVGIATAVYPLKLDDKTLSVEQNFFQELIGKASDGFTAQSGGGGNVDIYVDGEKAVKNLRSINFAGDGFSVTRNSRGNGVTVTNTGSGTGVAGNNDVGVLYLKNNTTATTITTANERQVIDGNYQTGTLNNFELHTDSNGNVSLKYTGTSSRFHAIATFNFYSNNNTVCGFYLGKNTDITTNLDPNADRISESEVYANAGSNNSKPVAATVQTVLDLNTNDRIFVICQNKTQNTTIQVEFMKLVAATLTSQKGDTGATGPAGGVVSLNGLTGTLSVTAGSNIVVTPSGSNIEVALASSLDGGSF
jgi:hypothetical protein